MRDLLDAGAELGAEPVEIVAVPLGGRQKSAYGMMIAPARNWRGSCGACAGWARRAARRRQHAGEKRPELEQASW
jgi:hypothetical protein